MLSRATRRKAKRGVKRIPAFDIRDEGTSLPDKNGGRPPGSGGPVASDRRDGVETGRVEGGPGNGESKERRWEAKRRRGRGARVDGGVGWRRRGWTWLRECRRGYRWWRIVRRGRRGCGRRGFKWKLRPIRRNRRHGYRRLRPPACTQTWLLGHVHARNTDARDYRARGLTHIYMHAKIIPFLA